jgi:HrpA-like RNA helicase
MSLTQSALFANQKINEAIVFLLAAAGALEPPAVESMDSALLRLKNLGAVDADNELTPLGRHLAALPVDVR